MPLKAFNVSTSVFLSSQKVRHQSVLPPHSTFYHLLERETVGTVETQESGARSHPNQSVERVQRVHHQLVPLHSRVTHRNRQLSEAMTQNQRGVTSPQSSDNGHLTNGDKMALASPSQNCVTWCNGHLMLSELITKNHIKKSHALTCVTLLYNILTS